MSSPSRPLRLLFVCTGNICRSPLAEALFAHHARGRGRARRYEVDSAGTHGWHSGEQADWRSREVGERHGVKVESRARALREADFERFDLILAMDREHLRELQARCPARHRHKLELMRAYDRPGSPPDVPDPYYGELDGFERVYAMLDGCCRTLLEALEAGRHWATSEPEADDGRA
jgi:protein-tyrosine phosphatase